MNALITGASGFLGSALARRLLAEGHRVKVLVRPTSDLQLLEGLEVEKMEGDVSDATSLGRAIADAGVVYHLAGVRRSPRPADFARINVEGTRNVLEAAARRTSPPRVVFASSLSALGPSPAGDQPFDESAPFQPVEAYGRSKADAELLCRAYADRVPVAIGRPPRVLGPGDRENLAFVKMVAHGLQLVIKGGPRPLSMIDVDDVTLGFTLLGSHPKAVGETFFLTAGGVATIEGIQEAAALALGRPIRRRLVVAPWGLRLSAQIADAFSPMVRKRFPLNRKLAEQLLAPAWTCSPAKAKAMLGFEARHTLPASVERSVRWYVDQGWVS